MFGYTFQDVFSHKEKPITILKLTYIFNGPFPTFQHGPLHVELTEEELRLIDPEAYKEKYDRETAEQPSYQKRVVLTPTEIEMLTTTEEKGGVDNG